MFSDQLLHIAGRSFTLTGHDIFMTFVSIALGLVFWTALYFSRKRVIVLKRSSGTDQVAYELSRIADALDRIANQAADRSIVEAARQHQFSSPLQRDSQGVAYSMFGR